MMFEWKFCGKKQEVLLFLSGVTFFFYFGQCDHIWKLYYHICLDLVQPPPPALNIAICKQTGLSKCIQPDQVIKVTKSGHTDFGSKYFISRQISRYTRY